MKKLLVLPLLFLVLSGCTSSSKDEEMAFSTKIQELEKQIATLQTEKEDNFFKKKQECASHKNDILTDLRKPDMVVSREDPQIQEIFYSSKRNSCMYIFRHFAEPSEVCEKSDLSSQYGIENCIQKVYELVDFFTKEWIYSSTNYDKCITQNESSNISNCKSLIEFAHDLR